MISEIKGLILELQTQTKVDKNSTGENLKDSNLRFSFYKVPYLNICVLFTGQIDIPNAQTSNIWNTKGNDHKLNSFDDHYRTFHKLTKDPLQCDGVLH